jgi:hypothetical protein
MAWRGLWRGGVWRGVWRVGGGWVVGARWRWRWWWWVRGHARCFGGGVQTWFCFTRLARVGGVVLLYYRVIVLLSCVLWVGKRVASRVCGEVMRQKMGAFGGVWRRRVYVRGAWVCVHRGRVYARGREGIRTPFGEESYIRGGCARGEGGCTCARGRCTRAEGRCVYTFPGRIVNSGRVYAYPAWGKACFWGGRFAQEAERRRAGRV